MRARASERAATRIVCVLRMRTSDAWPSDDDDDETCVRSKVTISGAQTFSPRRALNDASYRIVAAAAAATAATVAAFAVAAAAAAAAAAAWPRFAAVELALSFRARASCMRTFCRNSAMKTKKRSSNSQRESLRQKRARESKRSSSQRPSARLARTRPTGERAQLCAV